MRTWPALFLLLAAPLATLAQPVCSPPVALGLPAEGWRLSSTTVEQLTGGTVTSSSTTTVSYDAAGDPVLMTTTGDDPQTWARTFDALHRVAFSDRTNALGSFLDEYRYASATEAEQRFNWRGGTDWDSYVDRYVYTYDSECRLLQQRHEHRSTGEWSPWGRVAYSYVEGRLATVIEYGTAYGGTTNDAPMFRYVYAYTDSRLTQVERFQRNAATSSWLPVGLTTYAYTAEGRLFTRDSFTGTPGNWTPTSRQEYSYSPEGNNTLVVLSSWDGAAYVPTRRVTYVFEVRPVANEETPATEARLVVAGANPFAQTTRVRLSLDAPEAVVVTVHDALGRILATLHRGALSTGDHDWTVGDRLAPGVYVVRAQGATTTETVRVVRSR